MCSARLIRPDRIGRICQVNVVESGSVSIGRDGRRSQRLRLFGSFAEVLNDKRRLLALHAALSTFARSPSSPLSPRAP